MYAVGADGTIRISATADRAKAVNARRDKRVSLHVTAEDFWSYVVIEGDADVTATAAAPDDATVDELVELYRELQGEHPDWDEYRASMVTDRRLVIRIRPTHAYGMSSCPGSQQGRLLVGVDVVGVGLVAPVADERDLLLGEAPGVADVAADLGHGPALGAAPDVGGAGGGGRARTVSARCVVVPASAPSRWSHVTVMWSPDGQRPGGRTRRPTSATTWMGVVGGQRLEDDGDGGEAGLVGDEQVRVGACGRGPRGARPPEGDRVADRGALGPGRGGAGVAVEDHEDVELGRLGSPAAQRVVRPDRLVLGRHVPHAPPSEKSGPMVSSVRPGGGSRR